MGALPTFREESAFLKHMGRRDRKELAGTQNGWRTVKSASAAQVEMNVIGDPLTPEDLCKLERSWLTPEVVEQARIRRVDDATGRELVGRSGRSGEYAGLVFPYVLPGEDRVRDYRLRRDKPDIEYKDGKPSQRAKYLAPPGGANMHYFPPGTPPEALTDTSLPVVVTEGEKKGLALQRLATWKCDRPLWLAVAVSGVWNWHGTVGKTTGPNGERCDVKGTIPDFDRVGWQGRKVYVCYDSDVQKNASVKAARNGLARMLKGKGADVFFTDVPEGTDAAKQGVDDWLFAAGPEPVLAALKNARSSSVKVPAGFRLSDTGVFSVDPTGEKDDTFISSRLEIVACTRNTDGEEWGRLFSNGTTATPCDTSGRCRCPSCHVMGTNFARGCFPGGWKFHRTARRGSFSLPTFRPPSPRGRRVASHESDGTITRSCCRIQP